MFPLNLTVFVLTQKSKQKRSRLRPLSSKNRRDKGGNRTNSLHRCALEFKQRTIFNRLSHWFFGSSDEVSLQAVYRHCFLLTMVFFSLHCLIRLAMINLHQNAALFYPPKPFATPLPIVHRYMTIRSRACSTIAKSKRHLR